MRDRGVVKVDADELGVREGFRHQQRRSAVPAADIRDACAALKLFDDSIEGGQPFGNQMPAVSGTEEPLDAAEQAVAVLAPVQALAGLEGLGELRLVVIDGRKEAEGACPVSNALRGSLQIDVETEVR